MRQEKMGEKISQLELEFLEQSNYIESEYRQGALEDAIAAWKYVKRLDYVTTFDSILYCHYLLMRRIRPNIAGKLRNCAVSIGGRKCVFVSEQLLEEEINSLCREIEVSSKVWETPEAWTKASHIKFEQIHPFEDGNGRVGRIIYNAHRVGCGLPIHVIKERYRFEYYKWFK